MGKTIYSILTTCLFLILALSVPAFCKDVVPWVVYYSDEAAVEEFEPYQLIVLDSVYHPLLNPLLDRGKTILGYISLGEIDETSAYFDDIKQRGLLVQENENWKGSHFVDIRKPFWTSLVIEQMIPDILRRGFDGLFLDTVDNAIYLEDLDPEKYSGMKDAAVRLIRAIKLHYPHVSIMLNRGFEILARVDRHIDMVLGESIFADYDFEKKSYYLVDAATYEKQVSSLNAAKRRRPGLKIFTLDYWDPQDHAGIKQIYDRQRSNGFSPYVSIVELNRIVREPDDRF